MDTPWQLAWVSGRLVPRWIVEQVAGQRGKRVRLAFVGTSPEEAEQVALGIAGRLGKGWHVDIGMLRDDGAAARARGPFDLVWALGARDSLAFPSLAAWLVPGGCLVFSAEHPLYTAQGPQYLDEGRRTSDWLARAS